MLLKSCVKLKNEKDCNIDKTVRIRSDHGKEFENVIYADFCNKHDISHEFSTRKTLRQNSVVKRKNRTLQEIAYVILNSKKLSKKWWAKVLIPQGLMISGP